MFCPAVLSTTVIDPIHWIWSEWNNTECLFDYMNGSQPQTFVCFDLNPSRVGPPKSPSLSPPCAFRKAIAKSGLQHMGTQSTVSTSGTSDQPQEPSSSVDWTVSSLVFLPTRPAPIANLTRPCKYGAKQYCCQCFR